LWSSPHVGDAGHRTPSDVPSLKFVGLLPIPKIWLIFGHCIKRSGDPELSPFDL